MKHRLVALTAVVAVAFTGGCGLIESAAGAYPPAKSTASPTADARNAAEGSGANGGGAAGAREGDAAGAEEGDAAGAREGDAAGAEEGDAAGAREGSEPDSELGSGPGSGYGSVKDAGDIPDPCTLLSEPEVTHLTGRKITQIDEDGLEPGEGARFCQWQQSGGQLAVFLSRTTAEDFAVTIAEAEWVDGVGEGAFWHSGHLYVLYGTVQIDVYSRGADSDTQNLADAKQVAKVLIPRV
ncbi:hypothetical protein OHA21_07130 [Actinoplanes sp. NBC_00393]|uniref:hypothetical protein n=1 Tax=Actinoplanes sp. NBC_00393 TaxID=2975953 RepID=UPI002E24FE86